MNSLDRDTQYDEWLQDVIDKQLPIYTIQYNCTESSIHDIAIELANRIVSLPKQQVNMSLSLISRNDTVRFHDRDGIPRDVDMTDKGYDYAVHQLRSCIARCTQREVRKDGKFFSYDAVLLAVFYFEHDR